MEFINQFLKAQLYGLTWCKQKPGENLQPCTSHTPILECTSDKRWFYPYTYLPNLRKCYFTLSSFMCGVGGMHEILFALMLLFAVTKCFILLLP